MENNKNKKSVKFQGVMLNFYDFIQVFVFTTNHHLNKCIQCTCKCTWLNISEIATVFFWSPLQVEKDLEQIIARTHFVMH